MAAINTFCHVEWTTMSIEKSTELLSGLFGWEFKEWAPGYAMFQPDEGLGGGLQEKEEINPGDSPVIYVQVESIEDVLMKAEELSAEIKVPKTEIPTMGWFAHIEAFDGNIYGIYQEK